MSTENPYAPPEAEVSVRDSTELAGCGLRLGGAIIDSLIALAIIFPVMYATSYFAMVKEGNVSIMTIVGMGVFGIAVFLTLNGYLLAKHGQTIGKRLVKTRIVSIHDDRILPLAKVISLRYLPLWIVGWIPIVGSVASLVDPLFIFRADKRCVHDHIAGTKVINATTL